MSDRPNVLLIVVDAWRPKNTSCYGYRKSTTCNLDQLAEEGVLFEDAYSCANFTEPSLMSIFSGKYPLSHGITEHGGKIDKKHKRKLRRRGIKLLSEFLKKEGYATGAVDWLGKWFTKGFDYYTGIKGGKGSDSLWVGIRNWLKPFEEMIPRSIKKKIYSHIHPWLKSTPGVGWFDAKSTTDFALDFVEEHREKDFFLFLHYWDTHWPYNPPESYWREYYEGNEGYISPKEIIEGHFTSKERFRKGLRTVDSTGEMLAKYDGELALVDHEIGRLTEMLKEWGIFDDTLLLLTGDHGESLLEHGIFFRHRGLYDVSVHVPLILCWPEKLPQCDRIDEFVQHVDIVPTVLDFLESENGREEDFDGISLAPFLKGEEDNLRSKVFFQERDCKVGMRNNRYKYFMDLPGGRKQEKAHELEIYAEKEECLFDLLEDPDEEHNIAGDLKKKKKNLRSELLEWMNSLELKAEKEEKGEIRRSIKKLKASGRI